MFVVLLRLYSLTPKTANFSTPSKEPKRKEEGQ
jgi:hypothetical protein